MQHYNIKTIKFVALNVTVEAKGFREKGDERFESLEKKKSKYMNYPSPVGHSWSQVFHGVLLDKLFEMR